MKKKVQLEEAELKFREILSEVLKGKDVIILDKNKPIAQLTRIESSGKEGKSDRWTSDDFDIQLDEEH